MNNQENFTVDQMLQYMYSFNMEGNIIDHTWYKIILKEPTKTRPNGKPYREAIELLADIVYWYRPTIIKSENGNIKLEKKFKSDILQRSYDQIEESLGMSKREAVEALKALESYKIIKRELRTVKVNGTICSNVMFLRFYPQNLKKLTEEYFKNLVSSPEYSGDPPPGFVTPPPNIRETYTETTTKISTDNNNSCVVPCQKHNSNPSPKSTNPLAIKANECLLQLDVPYYFKQELTVQYTEEKLKTLVLRIQRWEGRESDLKAARHILNHWDSWIDEPTKEEQCKLQEIEKQKRYEERLIGRKKAEFYKERYPEATFNLGGEVIHVKIAKNNNIFGHTIPYNDPKLLKYFEFLEKKYDNKKYGKSNRAKNSD